MARRRKGRAIDGIFLLDKPLGISSNHALQRVKRAFFAAKAGHTGALDPLATGMLPICLGEATKFSQFLLDTDKTYQVTAKLGIRTTTSDADGEIVERKQVDVSREQLDVACETFRGLIKQVPSMYSALKFEGQPLYHYARMGIDIARDPREITVYKLEMLRFEGDEVDLSVHCSKGTYIRTLVDDLGQLLGCGAFVSRLHRSQVSDYPADKMLSLDQLDELLAQAQTQAIDPAALLDPLLLSMDTAAKGLPSVELDDKQAAFFNNGNPAQTRDSHELTASTQARVYMQAEPPLFMGVGEICADGRVNPRRVVVREAV